MRDMKAHAQARGPVLVRYENDVFPATLLGRGDKARVRLTNDRVLHVPRRCVDAGAPRDTRYERTAVGL